MLRSGGNGAFHNARAPPFDRGMRMPVQNPVLVSVRGRVQGVGFREWTVGQALALGLRGWVRNEADGSVSALVGGPDEAVEKMLDLLHIGPSLADVASVTARPAEAGDLPSGFTLRR
jgi:acylphosphatase